MSDLERLARRAILGVMLSEGVPGVLGKGDSSTTLYTDPAGEVHRDKCWVRIGDPSSTTAVVARNTKTPAHYGLPVIVADRNGVIEVIRADYGRSSEYTGSGSFAAEVGAHAATHSLWGPDPLFVEGMQVLPLMPRPQNPADMTVYVPHGFYRYLGTEKAWEGGNSADLSGYVPSEIAIGVAHHFVILCLDRANNVLVVVDGDDAASGDYLNPFAASDVAAIAIDDDYYPLAAIRFHQGQTAIHPRHIFMDTRLWGGDWIGASMLPDHADRHERGGDDEIDGDHLDVDWDPTAYTPDTSPSEADNADDLTAHLAGIDNLLGDPVSLMEQIVSDDNGDVLTDESGDVLMED